MSDESSKNKSDAIHPHSDTDDCPWYVNSLKHSNCFWEYVFDKSGPDGSMQELVQTEISQLMNWSNTKTHFMLKQAMIELVEALKKYQADRLLDPNPEFIVELSTFNIDPPEYHDHDE